MQQISRATQKGRWLWVGPAVGPRLVKVRRRNEWPPALARRPARPASRFLSSHTLPPVRVAGRR